MSMSPTPSTIKESPDMDAYSPRLDSKVNEEDRSAKRVWESTQDKMKEQGRWLIGEEVQSNGYKDLLERVQGGKKPLFRGTFILHNFPKNQAGRVDFVMTDKETSVGQIKKEVAKITGQPASSLAISFKGFEPIQDSTNLYYGLCCHGRGGENFHLSIKPKKVANQIPTMLPKVNDKSNHAKTTKESPKTSNPPRVRN